MKKERIVKEGKVRKKELEEEHTRLSFLSAWLNFLLPWTASMAFSCLFLFGHPKAQEQLQAGTSAMKDNCDHSQNKRRRRGEGEKEPGKITQVSKSSESKTGETEGSQLFTGA